MKFRIINYNTGVGGSSLRRLSKKRDNSFDIPSDDLYLSKYM